MQLEDALYEVGLAAGLVFFAELGDKSFFVAMLLASENSPTMVFIGCTLSFALTVLLACMLGHFLSEHLDHVVLELTGGILFVGFAALLLWQLARTPLDAEPENLELAEEDVLTARSWSRQTTPDGTRIGWSRSSRQGGTTPSASASASRSGRTTRSGRRRKSEDHPVEEADKEKEDEDEDSDEEPPWWRVLMTSFFLSFLGGLGDKTMFAMIMLAADHPPLLVGIGSMIGFTLIIFIAICCGRRLLHCFSQRMILVIGIICFGVFGVLSLALAVTRLRGERAQPEAAKLASSIFAAARPEGPTWTSTQQQLLLQNGALSLAAAKLPPCSGRLLRGFRARSAVLSPSQSSPPTRSLIASTSRTNS